MSLLAKLRSNIKSDEDVLKAKREHLRNPEVREALKRISRIIGKNSHCVSAYYGEVAINVTVSDLDSFKVGPFPKLIERLMNAGVEFDRTSDWPQSGNRVAHGKLGKVSVTVSGYLSGAAKNCQMKIVGERVSPIYELVCN